MSTVVKSVKEYFHGAIAEMKKVVWPSKQQTKLYTVIVIAMGLGMALFFGILDYVFNVGLNLIIQ